MSDPKVWIRQRKRKNGKAVYDLRWIDSACGGWKSETVGTDRTKAVYRAAVLEEKLGDGTYTSIKRSNWQAFTDRTVGCLTGTHAAGTRQALDELGAMFSPGAPGSVRSSMVRNYVRRLEQKKPKPNAPATINKKLRCLRLSFRLAIEDGYAAVCPVKKSHFRKEHKKDDDERRILSPEEEPALLDAAERLYGFPMRTFAEFTLETWGRLAEVTGLKWEDVDHDDPSVCFRSTKSCEDRYIPIAPTSGLVDKLRRLQAQTLQAGGPFRCFAHKSNLHKKWARVLADAGIPPITIHDLRRTGITRALLDNVPIAVVKDLAGHQKIETTMRYYKGIKKRDLRDAVRRRAASAG